ISAAMRNFSSFLNLTTPNPKHGQYELTPLGKHIITKGASTYQRYICDQNEPCRKVCPSGAISATMINANCLSCGLCVAACPYGALEIDCSSSPQLKFDVEICKKSSGSPKNASSCGLTPLLSEELTLQRWIKQTLVRVGITSEIPGVGEYPDLVIYDTPSFIEVKRSRVTKGRVDSIVNQVLRYSQEEVITKTLKHLKLFSDIDWRKPEFFVISAPQGGKEHEVIKKLEKELSDREVGFFSINKLYNLSLESYHKSINNFNLKFPDLLT
ncbi:MAG: 4Fe-4S binding protein, partial [Candidatus Heimdallarchaeaceae archaeon]